LASASGLLALLALTVAEAWPGPGTTRLIVVNASLDQVLQAPVRLISQPRDGVILLLPEHPDAVARLRAAGAWLILDAGQLPAGCRSGNS
jgi:hypothetical protein